MLINKYIKNLISSSLDEIIVGIDGITEKNYQKIRVGGDFDQVVNNVKLLLKEKPESLKVTVQFIETEDNEAEKDKFINFWVEQGAIVKIRNKLGWGPTLPSSLDKYEIERVPCPWLMRTVVVHWSGNVVQCGGDLSLVAHQNEAHVRVADESKRRRRNDHARTMITTHGVERYGDWSTHSPLPIWKIKAAAMVRRGAP